MPLSDRELLARLIRCEAEGEGDDGMRGVASVVMNRVTVPYGEFYRLVHGNIRAAIFQPRQFTCVMEVVNGQYNPQNIYNMTPLQIHYDIADWAMAGNTLGAVVNSLWYFNPFKPSCTSFFPPGENGTFLTRIKQHCYYIPTQKYART